MNFSHIAEQVEVRLEGLRREEKSSFSLNTAKPRNDDDGTKHDVPPLKSQPARSLKDRLPSAPAQEIIIEQATDEPFESFWKKYLHHTRRDLCLSGGVLHDQWTKWREQESKTVVRISYGWVAAMGIPAHSLNPVTVAATVFLLNAVVNIGIKTICEGCGKIG